MPHVVYMYLPVGPRTAHGPDTPDPFIPAAMSGGRYHAHQCDATYAAQLEWLNTHACSLDRCGILCLCKYSKAIMALCTVCANSQAGVHVHGAVHCNAGADVCCLSVGCRSGCHCTLMHPSRGVPCHPASGLIRPGCVMRGRRPAETARTYVRCAGRRQAWMGSDGQRHRGTRGRCALRWIIGRILMHERMCTQSPMVGTGLGRNVQSLRSELSYFYSALLRYKHILPSSKTKCLSFI
jgi:hypothetical protein